MSTRAARRLLVVLALLGCAARAAQAATERFALVVGNNASLDPTLSKLRFADDDAARFHELMVALGARAILLSVLNPETQSVFPEATRVARAPTREALRAAMRELGDGIRAARKRGAHTVLYFYFAGHGDVGHDREAYIHLVDGRFSRSDLYRDVIAGSPAHVNHVVIDACNSYFLINRRGGRGDRASVRQALRSFLAAESLDRYPNTGVVLSTASSGETHEWSHYRSGIFSHQFLSAMWGAADIDNDGRVDYAELSAYISAANLRVRDARAAPSVFAQPPRSNAATPLVDLKAFLRVSSSQRRPASGRIAAVLELPKALEGHYHLEDDRGVRYADFHKSDEQPLQIALLDRPYYYLRSARREARLTLAGRPDSGTLRFTAGALRFTERPLSARGSVEQSYRRDLYAVPFGRAFALGHAAGHGLVDDLAPADRPSPVVESSWRPSRTWKWVAAGAAAAALATGVTMQVLTARAQADLDAGKGTISMQRAAELQQQVNTRQAIAGIGFGVGGGLAITSLVLFLLDREPEDDGLGVAVDADGIALSGRF